MQLRWLLPPLIDLSFFSSLPSLSLSFLLDSPILFIQALPCLVIQKGILTMSQVSHRELDLSFSENMCLRKIQFFGLSQKKFFEDKYHFLREQNLICRSSKSTNYVLNNRAKMYLRYKRKDKIRFIVPTLISILALFGGYDVYKNPILYSLLRLLKQILKAIVENMGAFF